ncbi:hypothetical protein ABH931_005842 [Streptacidiphilus sp. MAP12-33]|uniref:hypothetical protein n=1 Tax=Streptacidiphilus sp. MAP12-33 TaxID=3156266 RepID=UPI0035169953
MPETSFPTRSLIDAVVRHAGRATLPFEQAHTGRHRGTAFWYNDLVSETAESEQYRQFLVTATGVTGYELAQWTLRPQLCEPQMSAELLMVPDFQEQWTALPGLGVSVLPAGGLHQLAARKGWRWSTDEITEGIGATSDDLSTIADAPVPAFVLGHDVGPDGERGQLVATGEVLRHADDGLCWGGDMPVGCVGAPVFTGLRRGDGSWKLVCLGVVLPGPRNNLLAPFDRIRAAVRALPD